MQACGTGNRESCGGCQGVTEVKVQVYGVLCQEKMWGEGVKERCCNDDHY